MPEFLKLRWPLWLVLAALGVLKLPLLSYAFYWDESWPYAPAFKYVYHHGLGLLPDSVDLKYSHGHPPVFYFLGGLWMKVFGDSNIALHSFALCISALLLVSVYETGLHFFNRRTGIIALLLFSAQEAFIVQSSMVLPEILVALLGLLSIACYTKQRFAATFACLTLLVFTKESGVLVAAVLGIDAAISLFRKSMPANVRMGQLLAVSVPCTLFCAYLLLQKKIMGWYFYPEHTSLIQNDLRTVWYNFNVACCRTAFSDQGRFYYFILPVLFGVFAAIRQRNARYAAILLPAICIFYFIGEKRADRAIPYPFFFLIFVLIAVPVFIYAYRKLFSSTIQKRLFTLGTIFVLAYMVFSAFNFFTPRYMLAALVMLFIITAALLDLFISKTNDRLMYAAVALPLITGSLLYRESNSLGDCERHSADVVKVQQQVADYFTGNVPVDKTIGTASFLDRAHLSDPNCGFIGDHPPYTSVSWNIDKNTDYAIFIVICEDGRLNAVRTSGGFTLIKRFNEGAAWAEIYERNKLKTERLGK